MDLLYSESVDAFCIVSSDSDFTRLAMRLRESGKRVYGIGARKTPSAFQNACDRFTYVEVLIGDDAAETVPTPTTTTATRSAAKKASKKSTPPRSTAAATRSRVQELTGLLLPAVEASAKEDGWAELSAVGQYVVNTSPTFDSRNYGYPKLSTLVRDLPRLEVKEVATGTGLTMLYVREAAQRTRKRS
jgi:uncharacterized LabA/DUF88 family protein